MNSRYSLLLVKWLIVAMALVPPAAQAQTNATGAAPAALSETAEAELFFERFGQAARLVEHRQVQEATVLMDLLSKSLSQSPWFEIALLKYSQLCEGRSDLAALESYSLLLKRLDNAPYFQGEAEHARVFKASLQGATQNGIDRVRVSRIKVGLQNYYSRYAQYPESLAKLAILHFVEMEDILDSRGRPFRYIPTGIRQTPFVSYHSYEGLRLNPADPFSADSPRIQGTSLVSDTPKKYAALLSVPGRIDAQQVVENQTLEGFFVATIAARGVIACTPDRVLVL